MTTHPAVALLAERVDRRDPGGVLGLSVVGSWAVGGLRPDSDVDLLLVTRRSLRVDEREELLTLLLQHSGRRATVAPGRPLELTSVVRDDLVPWAYPPRCDFLYGEWLPDELAAGGHDVLRRATDGYLGAVADDWSGDGRPARTTALQLAARVKAALADPAGSAAQTESG